MPACKQERKRQFLLNCAVAAAVAALVWVAVRYLAGLIMPFILGYLIAALVQPSVNLLHRRLRIKRPLAGILCVLLFVLFAIGIFALAAAKTIEGIVALTGMLPGLIGQFADALQHTASRLTGFITTLPTDFAAQLRVAVGSVAQELTKISNFSDGALALLFRLVTSVPGLLLDVIVTIVSACFISMDYPDIRGFVLRQLPKQYQEIACEIKNFFFITIARLVRAYFVLMLITFLELAVGLFFIGVPNALTLAAIIALVDIMPILGTGTVMIPWAAAELLLGRPAFALCLAVLYGVIAVMRNILEPRIVGGNIGLYPLVTFVSMFVGLKALGVGGMFLLPIAVILLKHLQDVGMIHLWKD